ncbi:hypothetical protein ACG04R_07470 [Roseateles sp. BYS78W]|uniref:J domain-containing protein n=1 Tax=Pelomonas candidula TaxID=3299025 RepID=A0ABW7HAK0_9BURK
MWDEDWALLGIEPTTELGAIKKAYALKLKTTRPDDDAQAYQALRGAYERAQAWVKWRVQELMEPAPNEPAAQATPEPLPPAAAPPPPAQALTPSIDVLQELPRAPTPQELVADVEQQRLRCGAMALAQHLPALLQALNEVPVGQAEATSRAFAQWVLRHDDVPLDVLAALAAQFGWRGDYRAERALGADLSAALQTELDLRMPVPITDPELIEQAAPLLGLEQLRRRRLGGRLALLLGAFCVHSLQRLRAAFGDRLLRGLGLSPGQQTWLDNALMLSAVIRGLLPAALFAWASYALLEDWEKTARFVGLSFAAILGLRLLMKGAGLALWWDARQPGGAYFAGLVAWRSRQSSEWPGLALVVTGAAVAELVMAFWPAPWLSNTLGLLLVTAGMLTLRWGNSLAYSRALAGCLVAAALAMWSALGAHVQISTAAALGTLWTFLGWLVFEGRHPQLTGSPLAWLVRPVSNTLALCTRWGWGFASWPLLAVSAMALDAGLSGSLVFEWGAWNIVAFLLFISQNTVDGACHRWLARQVSRA